MVVEPSGTDGRVRSVRLTAAGLAERAVLDERSDAAAAVILSRLSPRQRARLAAAMAETERLLTASAVEVAERDPGHPDAQFCLQAYFGEIAGRFDGGFDPARSPVREEQLAPPAGLFLVATLHGEPVGCGGIKFPAGAPAYIKRMWVSPAVRGLGLGRRLLAELEERGGPPPDARRPARNQPGAARGHRPVPLGGLPRGRAVQRRALRPPLVRKGPRSAAGRHPLALARILRPRRADRKSSTIRSGA